MSNKSAKESRFVHYATLQVNVQVAHAICHELVSPLAFFFFFFTVCTIEAGQKENYLSSGLQMRFMV